MTQLRVVGKSVFIKNYSNSENVLATVDLNIQWVDTLSSRNAKAYRMKLDTLGHQKVRGRNTVAAIGRRHGVPFLIEDVQYEVR